MQIYEYQYEVGNIENSQGRIISSYNTFDEYLQYLFSDRSKETYPSLPRQCRIITSDLFENEHAVELEFQHPVFRKNFIHKAHVVNFE